MNAPLLCSGYGQFHSANNKSNPRNYLRISLAEVRAKLETPQKTEKAEAQWAIFSTLPSREHNEQREKGEFFALWADIDDTGGLTLAETFSRAFDALGCNLWAYTSRSATPDNQKARLIVPLAESVPGALFVTMQAILNEKLEAVGLTTDKANERAGQLCYLPNRGEYYKSLAEDGIGPLEPSRWKDEIDEHHQREKDAQAARERAQAERKAKAQQMMDGGQLSVIDAFNLSYDLPSMLETFGYERKGPRWLSPNSESGIAGVEIDSKGKTWFSAHASDAGIGTATSNGSLGDAFDLFVHYQHNGNRNAALKAAGEMLRTPDGQTVTQANQQRYRDTRSKTMPDVSALLEKPLNGKAQAIPSEAAWPELVPLATKPPARLPIDEWPAILRDYALEAAEETETPPELPAMLALGAVAAAVQRFVSVKIKPGYIEPCCLFTAIALPPATRKSAEHRRAARPLVQWEAKQREHFAELIAQAESAYKTHKEQCKELRKQAAKVEGAQAERMRHELAELEANTPQIPKAPRIWTSDVTTEHLATMMQDNGESMAVMAAEGGIFDTMAGRYNQGVPNIDLYLMGHAGDAVRVDRGSKPSVVLDDPRLTMVLAVQPDVLTSLSTKPGFRGRGLLGRFLFVLPPSNLGKRKGNAERMDSFTLTNYESAIANLLEQGHRENAGQVMLELEPYSYTAWQDFSNEIEAGLADGGRFEHCRDWAGKLPGAVGRIAGLFHAMQDVSNFAYRPIAPDVMRAAIATGAALAEHALAAFGLMGADPAIEDAKHLLGWIRRKGLAEFTQRDAHRNHGSRWPKANDMLAGLCVLEERGYIRKRETSNPDKSGRPSIVFDVNPIALAE
jgi:hypothetical protein